MELLVKGKAKLEGQINISSSKNSILPIIAASLLTDDNVIINKVPEIKDVIIINKIIEELGINIKRQDHHLEFSGALSANHHPSYELVKQMRASFLLIGPLLARLGKIRISLPGGCAIGNRPIDLHLKGFHALGADISLSSGDIVARGSELNGTHIYLDYPSVGATENLMMAASMANGTSYIENTALEPEIVDLANFINSMGGKVSGAGTNVIKIQGVKELRGINYTPIPDRIEAGSYMVAIAATAGNATIHNVIPEHLKAISAKLIESGSIIMEGKDSIQIIRKGEIKPVYIKTLPFPGFPTDMQAQFMAYLSCANGSSVISESVFENRFMHVQELQRMGANITTEGRTAIIKGVPHLSPARVKITDLRAGAALLIAALMTEGETILYNREHIERGYENIIEKMTVLGAKIKKI